MQNNPLRDSLRETYDRYARERDASAIDDWKIQVRTDFLALCQAEGRQTLLEIGAGPGRDSLFFQAQGLRPVCIDISPAMVALCQEKGLAARVMDAAALDFPDGSFAAVYALNSLLHLPKAELPAALRQVERVLAPGGVFFLGLYGGDDTEGILEADTYRPKRFFASYSDNSLEAVETQVFTLHAFNRVYFDPVDLLHFQSLILRRKS
jgi:SAM-dependent methyltransferase